MPKKINNKFTFGDKVTHVCDDTSIGMITGIIVRGSHFTYLVTWDDKSEKTHYECELESIEDKGVVIKGFQLK